MELPERQEQLKTQMSQFCMELLDGEFAGLRAKVLLALDSFQPVSYTRGRIEIWAAAYLRLFSGKNLDGFPKSSADSPQSRNGYYHRDFYLETVRAGDPINDYLITSAGIIVPKNRVTGHGTLSA